MLGILVLLLLSWLLLFFFQRSHLSVLGVKPSPKRLRFLAVGFAVASACCGFYFLFFFSAITGNAWTQNKDMSVARFLNSLWWVVKGVCFEELLFRGALLYIAVRRIGERKACLLSALSFGVYHWFSYSAFGNPVQMIFVFVLTGFMGWALAYAFVKTGSLWLPIGVHVGWNLMSVVVFSNGPLGKQLFVLQGNNQLQGIELILGLLFQLFALPLFTIWYSRKSSAR